MKRQGIISACILSCFLQISNCNAETVVCFGDSITAGLNGNTSLAYPTYLQPMLDPDATSIKVVNAGKGGEATYSGVSRIEEFLTLYQPQYVMIMEGANDVTQGISPSTTSFNLKGMAQKVINAGGTPIMSTITPNSSTSYTPENYNPMIVQAAAEIGASLVDSYSNVIADWPSISVDDKHPNSKGAKILAQGFANQLQSVKSSQSGGGSSGCFIATAAYGTALEPQVVLLQKFRDLHLLTNTPGQTFVKLYYTYSPPFADFIARHNLLRLVVRISLLPLLALAWLLVEATAVQQVVLLLSTISLLSAVWVRMRQYRQPLQ